MAQVEHGGAVAHAAADYMLAAEAVQRFTHGWPIADPATGRLQTERAATGSGNSNRTAAVVAMRDRHQSGRYRRRGAAAGAAGRIVRVPGIVHRAMQQTFGGDV